MRRRTIASLGAVAASLAGGAVLAAPPLSPPATASDLPAFADCEELRQWYVDSALPMVGPWGLEYPGSYYGTRDQPTTGLPMALEDASGTDAAVGNGATGTNVQEAGVDEPDVAKTDGTLVVHVARGRNLVVTDVSGQPRELSRVALPVRLGSPELLLVGDTVVVIGVDTYYGNSPVPMDTRIAGPSFGEVESSTSVITISIADPTSPRVELRQRYGGGLVSAREYDGTLRLVLTTGRPTLDFVEPDRDRTPAQARRENREIVRGSTIEDWLPQVTAGSVTSPLLECTDVRHPEGQSGFGTISVVTFDARTPADASATAVTAAGELVYSSADRLYLATVTGGWWGEPVPLPGARPQTKPQTPGTQVHAFALDGLDTTYVASGEVPGTVKDRWSFSEYDGRLRVATALGDDLWDPVENAVVVLEERGDDLVEIGRVDRLGIGEDIKSVRWFGDLAVVVTFRQVDPLYTIDLADPTDPEVLGKLKIPGFSAYLHPIGDDRLLGLGQNATLRGMTVGAQAAVFDIGDLGRPERVSTAGFGGNTELTAAWDPRAFTYLPEQRTALTPVQSYMSGQTRLAILKLAKDGTITRTTTGVIGGFESSGVRALPLGGGLVALVADGEVTKLSI